MISAAAILFVCDQKQKHDQDISLCYEANQSTQAFSSSARDSEREASVH